jgi:hypothetical protein
MLGSVPLHEALGITFLDHYVGQPGVKCRVLVCEEHALLSSGQSIHELEPEAPLIVDCEPDGAPQPGDAERGTPHLSYVIDLAREELLDQE